MCFDACSAHKICMGPEGYNAFSAAVSECCAEEKAKAAADAAADEDFCILGFFKNYVDKKMCVMDKLGWTNEDGTPDYENVRLPRV